MNLQKLFLILLSLAAFSSFVFAAPAHAEMSAVLTVNLAGDFIPTNCDEQSCLLREAILASNATPGVQEAIQFKIPTDSQNCDSGTGVCTIKLLGALPDITDPVIIDGYSQKDAHPNTLAVGDNAALKIVLDGNALDQVDVLKVTGGNTTIKGLVIQNAGGEGINLQSNNNVVAGNFIGTDVSGNVAKSNKFDGINITGANNTIGGLTPDARNILSGNAGMGLQLVNATKTTIVGNYIGTNAAGQSALPNDSGIYIANSSFNTIGGKGAGARNVLSGNSAFGAALIYSSGNNVLRGNYIGVAANGTDALPNTVGGVGIVGDAQVGFARSNTIAQNIISHNGMGIYLGADANDMSSKNTFTRNAIFENNSLGIDIFPVGTNNPNDKRDKDKGPNDMQNYPTLKQVSSANGSTTIQGTLNSAPNQPFRIEFFVNSPCEDGGHGEGKKYFGSVNVKTNAQGSAPFTFVKYKTLAKGSAITATATQRTNAINGSTSEFSACQGIQ